MLPTDGGEVPYTTKHILANMSNIYAKNSAPEPVRSGRDWIIAGRSRGRPNGNDPRSHATETRVDLDRRVCR